MTDLTTISAFMDGHAGSGLSVAAYARQIGMSQWQAYEWRKRWRRHQRRIDAGKADGASPVDQGAVDAAIETVDQAVGEQRADAADVSSPLHGSGLFRRVVPVGGSPSPADPTEASSSGLLRIAVGSDCQLMVADRQGVALAALFVQQLQAEGG